MKRYEVIKVRFALDVPEDEIAAVLKSLETADFGADSSGVYQVADIPRDMAWIIPYRGGESTGVHLAAILGEYGQVDRTIWNRIEK